MVLYVASAGIGAVCGVAAFLLSLGVLQKRKLIPHLIKFHRFPAKRALISIFIGAAIGCYGVWVYSGINYEYISFIGLTSCLHCAALTDIRHKTLHSDSLVLFAVVGVIACLLGGGLSALLEGLVGAAAGAVLLGIPHLLRRDSVGTGDVILLAVSGLYCGAYAVLLLLLRALIILAIVSVIQLLRKKATGKSAMPLAPFLLIGSLI